MSSMPHYLLSPHVMDQFLSKYWCKEVLHIRRNDPAYFRNVLSLDDFETLIAYSLPREDSSKVRPALTVGSRKGATLTEVSLEAGYYERYARGETLVVNYVHRRWKPVAKLCRALTEVFRCDVVGNVYLTPRNAQGFAPHFDTHDVFVLQLHGQKTWRIRGSGYRYPLLRHQLVSGLSPDSLPEGYELTVKPGDVVYIPRGVVHEANTSSYSSMHLTLGLKSITVDDLLVGAVKELTERNERLRMNVPLADTKAARAKLRAVLEKAFARIDDDILAAAEKRLYALHIGESWALPGKRIEAIDRAAEVTLTTRVVRRAGMPCAVTADEDGVTLTFPENSMRAPKFTAPALRFISKSQSFAIDELPGRLSSDAKLVIVRRLIEHGLLIAADDADGLRPQI